MNEKKIYVKPHERRGKNGTEHVKGHTRKQDVKNRGTQHQEIPEEDEEDGGE